MGESPEGQGCERSEQGCPFPVSKYKIILFLLGFEMIVRGIWADEHRFDPEQWVNVYQVEIYDRLSYYTSCQVKELEQLGVDTGEFYLEPTDEDGNLMAISQATANR